MKEPKKILKNRKRQQESIAIVGMGCRFPGEVNNPQAFWELLTHGKNAITEVPLDRWNLERFYDPEGKKAGTIKTCKGGFMDKFDQFDSGFFGLYPAVTSRLDPQQRFLLETTYEALEDAGISLENFSGSNTAVFMGVFMNDYWDMQASSLQRDAIEAHTAMGAARTSAANRLSYVYNLKGPSVTLDTACSSSLVGVHLACQSIWNGESTQALAGGVNIMCRPETSIMLSKGGFLSPDGTCKTYDSRANGYVRSEGCGVVVLKPLSQAQADGDPIYATILGSAVNQDGYTEEGFTVPSLSSQVEMLRTAYQNAGVDPREVAYVEAHGTGTPVGDPIETNAFGEVLGKDRTTDEKYWVGSVKTNIGHAEAAAGIAGLIKLALVLQNKKIPQNLHFEHPNPKIPFEQYRIQVPTELTDLPETDQPAIGGVNSFGAGGTNAHLVLEQYKQPKVVPPSPAYRTGRPQTEEVCLFTLSGQSEQALKANATRYAEFLITTEASLANICFTAQTRRAHHQHRLSVAARTKAELREKLLAFLQDETRPGMHAQKHKKGHVPKVGFIFSGQGPQWFAMGQQLIQSSPVFKEVILKIDRLFSQIADWSLLEEMNRDEATSRVSDTRIAQPAIMAVQIGLTELWKSWGVMPEGCVGHSIGEVAAAYAAGALTLEQAVEVIYHRSRGQNRATGKGKMLAAALTLNEAQEAIQGIEEYVSIAAINGPNMMTFSGDVEPLERLAQSLDERDIFHRFLRVNVPFHSHHMEPLKEELIESLTHLVPGAATQALYSTVTGQLEDGLHLDSNYWYRNVREPVYFTDALQQMIHDGFDTFIEIAPHPVLTTGAINLLKISNIKNTLIVPSLRRKEDEALTMMGSLGMLHSQGYPMDWSKLKPEAYQFVKLPAYVWQHERYWFETPAQAEQRLEARIHPHIKSLTKLATQQNLLAELSITSANHPYLEDHQIDGTAVFPATGHLEVVQAVAHHFFENQKAPGAYCVLEDITLRQAVFLPAQGEEHYQARLEMSTGLPLEDADEQASTCFTLLSRASSRDAWKHHSQGVVTLKFAQKVIPLEDIQLKINHPVSVADFYLELKESGLQYGEAFRNIRKLWINQQQQALLAQVELGAAHRREATAFGFHPALLDACLHAIEYAGKWTNEAEKSGIYLPVHIESFVQYASPTDKVFCYVELLTCHKHTLLGNFTLYRADGTVVARLNGVTCRYIEGSRGEAPRATYQGLYEYLWQKAAPVSLSHSYAARVNGDATGGCLLLIEKDSALSLQQYFTSDHLNPICLYPAEQFDRVSATEYCVRPDSEQDLQAVLSCIKQDGYAVRRVLYAWGLAKSVTDSLQENQQQLAAVTLSVMRCLVSLDPHPEICLLTQGCEQIMAEDTLVNLGQAALYGIGRVISNEYPGLALTLIDMSERMEESALRQLYDYFTLEKRDHYAHLAFRAGVRYALQLTPVENPGIPEDELTLCEQSTYLVTGGASGFGLRLSEWMTQRGARHLALLSRSGPKTEQDQEDIARLRELGVSVGLYAVDITQREALRDVLKKIEAEMPPVKGLIHSAAVLHDTTLANTTLEDYNRVFEPKALGAWHLHTLTQGYPLDFFLTISSVSAILGLPGQVSYASANNFLDKLAAYRKSMGLAGSSINLGVLGDYAGMSRDGGAVMQMLASQGWIVMKLAEVLNKIEHVLLHKPTQRMAALMDWEKFGLYFPHWESDFRFKHLLGQAKNNGKAELKIGVWDRLSVLEEQEQAVMLTRELAAALARIVGADAQTLDTSEPITTLGLDSLMLTQLRNHISRQLHINYPLMRLTQGPSLEALADQLLALHLDQKDQSSEQFADSPQANIQQDESTLQDASGISLNADLECLEGNWLVRRKRSKEPVRARIFCIHPVGAGASLFSWFMYQVPEEIEVLAFQLPGRENRYAETPLENMDQLIIKMLRAIDPYLEVPFMVMGHSFGGIIGYELLRALVKQRNLEPLGLMVTGTIAPQLTPGWKRSEAIAKTAERSYSEEKIIGILNYIDDLDFLRSILPVMRGDMPLIMSYQYRKEGPVNFPITAFAAEQDEVVSIEQIRAWQAQTSHDFSLEVVQGDHWFLSRHQQRILDRLLEVILVVQ